MDIDFYSLTMVRGQRRVFIGLFATKHRATLVATNLGWHGSWKPHIQRQHWRKTRS